MAGMSSRTEQAIQYFAQGFSCSQAVLAAFAPDLGMDADTALKTAQPFGGGMAQKGKTCGAVTGAFMALGLKYGRTRAEDYEARDKTYALMQEFMTRFMAEHGALDCRDLLGYRLDDPEQHALAKKAGLFQDLCPKLVENAADLLEDLLFRE